MILLQFERLDDIIAKEYGERGNPERDGFDSDRILYDLGLQIKRLRKEKGMTQAELGRKIDNEKGYISRIESGKVDMKISTLVKLFEKGFEKRLGFTTQELSIEKNEPTKHSRVKK